MDLQNKIIKLRKSMALSQEELAEKLGVSRQAVSKWESGQSLPDIDKIVLMSSFFGVSTDYLLKDKEEAEQKTQHGYGDNAFDSGFDNAFEACETQKISTESIKTALFEKYREARLIATAVLLFILSPLALICLLSLADAGVLKQPLALALGLLVIFFTVPLGVGLCIYSSFLIAPHKSNLRLMSQSPDASVVYENEMKNTEKRRRISYILGTSFTIISPLPIIFYGIFEGFEGAAVLKSYLFFPLCMAFLFIFVSVGVSLLTNAVMRDEALKLLTLKPQNKKKTVAGEIIDIYWTALPFIYLLISFLTGRWEITWIIWPLSPIIPQIISLIVGRKR